MNQISLPKNNVEVYNGKKMTNEEISLVKDHVAKGASDAELKIFLAICQRTGLDPFSRQIYLVPRWDSKLGKEVRITQVGIDGFRAVAERSGKYAGSDDPEYGEEVEKTAQKKKEGQFTGETYKANEWARVTVYKIVEGVKCGFTSTAYWSEYYPGDMQGFMWRTKPHVMLSKCAEAQALRKAFPMMLSGFYIPEEIEAKMDDSDSQGSDFDVASEKLKKVKSAKTLTEFIGKIKASDKYSAEEKVELEKIINNRIKELATKKK